MRRIAFHLLYEFHRAMLEPIYDLLKHDYDCLLTFSQSDIIAFKPNLLFIADCHAEQFRKDLPKTLIIWTRHGFSSKNIMHIAINACDFACISSLWVKEKYLERNFIPRLGFWITGFVPMDKVFKKISIKNTIYWPSKLNSDSLTLLYAPTYNNTLSAETVLHKTEWISKTLELLPHLNIIIKPHPVIPDRQPLWMEQWRQLAQMNHQVFLIEDTHANIFDYFSDVDIMLSDASSVFLYFIACDKPIILINNSKILVDRQFYDSEGPEWQWRDCAYDVHHAEQLPQVIQHALSHPNELQEKRLYYKNLIFGEFTNGDAAQRTADYIKKLLNISSQEIFSLDDFVRTIEHRNKMENVMQVVSYKNSILENQVQLLQNQVNDLEKNIICYQKRFAVRLANKLSRLVYSKKFS